MTALRDPFATGTVVHTNAYRIRRFLNWFPLGLTYAFLYMGRYNLTVAKTELGSLMTKEDFGIIFGVGTVTYGFAFLLNGPLTDRFGGKKAMLVAALGSGLMNLIMGYAIWTLAGNPTSDISIRVLFSFLYAANMYFQSFGAVAIVKVNASWFHVKERGGFSGIFGTMISSGIFLAFTVNGWIVDLTRTAGSAQTWWVFFAPTIALWAMFVIELILLKDRPGQAGHEDIETGDDDSGDDGSPISTWAILRRIFTHPIILTVAFIEFCTGVLRNGVMHWFPIYAKEVWVLPSDHWLVYGNWGELYTILPFFGVAAVLMIIGGIRKQKGKPSAVFWSLGGVLFLVPFMQGGWGGLLMVAGVIGGNVAGWVSDIVFQSRRAPVAALLYGLLCVASVGMFFSLGSTTNEVSWAKEGKTQLQPGDVITEVNGQATEDWTDISREVACLPAACEGDAKWDTEKCWCSTKPKLTADDLKVSTGVIPVVVQRGGETLTLELKDPKPKMRAGDKRKLPAGPVLPLSPTWLGVIVFLMSLAVIGTHGLLSGTATMDFGGKRGAATAVGAIDGFVYLGTGLQSFSLGIITSWDWSYWPVFLFPFGLLGLYLLTRIWNAVPKGKKAAH
ncbi:MAG: MFS transporter [Deltaproteobacteria bacterium]|nr:MFS transporter [Deltaproteobacteria bacterium]